MRKTGSLLELLAQVRTIKALDRAVSKDSYYNTTLKAQSKAYDELEKAGLDEQQEHIVNEALCCLNANGTAYGKVAYRLGLRDGIRLMSELNKI